MRIEVYLHKRLNSFAFNRVVRDKALIFVGVGNTDVLERLRNIVVSLFDNRGVCSEIISLCCLYHRLFLTIVEEKSPKPTEIALS